MAKKKAKLWAAADALLNNMDAAEVDPVRRASKAASSLTRFRDIEMTSALFHRVEPEGRRIAP